MDTRAYLKGTRLSPQKAGRVADQIRGKRVDQAMDFLIYDKQKSSSVIKKLLETSSQFLNKGGRLVCISYHSLEDRLVKRYIQNGSFNQQVESDIYGNKNISFKKIGKIVTPSEDELNKNKRSRSAKLRIAEKIWKIFYRL